MAPAGLEQRQGRRRTPRRRRGVRARHPPTSVLWMSPAASSLSATGRPIRRATETAVAASGTGRTSATGDAGRGDERQALALRQGDRRTGRRDGSVPGRPRTRCGRLRGRRQVRRHGPARATRFMPALPARDLGDRPERRNRPAQERRTASGRRRATPSSRAAAHRRSATRRRAGCPGGPPSRRGARRVTSLAVFTSDGSERYGKSWTRTRTS